MRHMRSVRRSAQIDLHRRVEKVLLAEARPRWLGSRNGLKKIVRQYIRRYRNTDGLRSLLRSSVRVTAAVMLLLQLYATPTPVRAATLPTFATPPFNPFGLGSTLLFSFRPTFVDLDSDGDVDVVTGEVNGSLMFVENTGDANNPAFAAPVNNPFGLSVSGLNNRPSFADLDGDGDLDLMNGERYGRYYYYENSGSSSSPSFATAILNPFGLSSTGTFSTPAFTDLDGDGDLDLLSGDRDGNFFYHENTGSTGGPSFAAVSTNAFGLSDIGSQTIPSFVDLDGDGDMDMISGEQTGGFHYFENTGSSSSPAFAAPVNPIGFSSVGGRSSPSFVDLDGDGDLDLLSGENDGGYFFFENIPAATEAPIFTASSSNPFGLSQVENYSRPSFADLDGDGDLDLLVGTYYGNFHYFENTGSTSNPAFAAFTDNPFGLGDLGWNNKPVLVDLDGDGDLDIVSGEYYGNFMYFENTGSTSSPAFAPSINNPFGLSNEGLRSAPTFVDLDNDGDLDLISKKNERSFVYFENTGSSIAPAFEDPADNPFGLHNISRHGTAGFADLDYDGDLDLINGGDDGGFFYFENTGSASNPAFARSLLNPFGMDDIGYYSRPEFADLDGDGDLDLISGQSYGNFIFFENTAPIPILRGDVTFDGDISILDLIRTVNIIIGREPAPDPESDTFMAADMNEDEAINILDVTAIINNILGITTRPAASAPAPVFVSLDPAQMMQDGRMVVPLKLDTEDNIVGMQATFTFDPDLVDIGLPYLAGEADGLKVQSHIADGTLRVLVYATSRDVSLTGVSGALLHIPTILRNGIAGTPELTLSEIILADPQARYTPVQLGNRAVSIHTRDASLPTAFDLHEAAPNPFNPATTIAYDVPHQAHVSLVVYNLLGQEVVRLVDGEVTPGRHQVTWNGRNTQGHAVASGIYVYRLTTDDGFAEVNRMTLLK